MNSKSGKIAKPVISDILGVVDAMESADDFPKMLGPVLVDLMTCNGEDSDTNVDLLRPDAGSNEVWGAMVRIRYENVEKAEVNLHLTVKDEESGVECGLSMISGQSYHPLESVKVGPDFLAWLESKLNRHMVVCEREMAATLASEGPGFSP